MQSSIVIFTDGACSGNPGPGGWGSIVVLPDGSVRELGGGDRKTTNNKMEMIATIRALELLSVPATSKILLYTDSTYVIRGITQWVFGWRSRGWKTAEGKDVANKELWEELLRQVMRLKPSTIEWKYIRGHSGFDGNERCDQIAVAFSKDQHISLYDGALSSYPLNLDNLPADLSLPDQKGNNSASKGHKAATPASAPKSSSPGASGSSKSGLSYLSYLSGVVVRHKTWAACERRVKGQPAKFKKVNSAREEQDLLKSWGLDAKSTIVDDR